MKKAFLLIALLLGLVAGAEAQNTLNNNADAIVGTYSGKQGSDNFRAKITRLKNGTYQAQITWVEHDRDSKGNKLLDSKNPDKKLRSTPCDRIVLFSGLRYDAKAREWSGSKIYDPTRGMRAKLVASWTKEGQLRLKCSVLGISKSLYWQRIEK